MRSKGHLTPEGLETIRRIKKREWIKEERLSNFIISSPSLCEGPPLPKVDHPPQKVVLDGLGGLASSSIVFSAAYTMFMFRIVFGGSLSEDIEVNISDVNKREFLILLTLVVLTVLLGIYPAPILDGLHYSVSSLIYCSPSFDTINSNVALLCLPFCSIRSRSYTTKRTASEAGLVKKSKFCIELGPLKKILNPEFVTGCVDGKGSFNISITKSKKQKIGWSVKPKFLIELNADHFALLKEI